MVAIRELTVLALAVVLLNQPNSAVLFLMHSIPCCLLTPMTAGKRVLLLTNPGERCGNLLGGFGINTDPACRMTCVYLLNVSSQRACLSPKVRQIILCNLKLSSKVNYAFGLPYKAFIHCS